MRIVIDEKVYNLSLDNTGNLALLLYKTLNENGVKLKNGKVYYFNRTSLMRTTIKSVFGPGLISFLQDIYRDKSYELAAPIKHEDLLDYFAVHLIQFLVMAEKELTLNVTTETGENSEQTIKSLATSWAKKNEPRNSSERNSTKEPAREETAVTESSGG